MKVNGFESVGGMLALTLRQAGQAFAPGDQTAPVAVLWPDPERLWDGVIQALKCLMPELYSLGDYDTGKRTGPPLWLRCIEARVVEGCPPAGMPPLFHLPGVGKEQLRSVEDLPPSLNALAELQFRGTTWLHENGREWTPYAFFVSKRGGLGLNVAKDQETLDALQRALPMLLSARPADLEGRVLDAAFFNELLAPDPAGLVLKWMSDPTGFRQSRSNDAWMAFCDQCRSDLRFDPEKDGPLRAAQLLATRENYWAKVGARFSESPSNYAGVVEWLNRAAPRNPTMFDSAEVWPHLNERDELYLAKELASLADRPQNQVIAGIATLEEAHGPRRNHPWAKMGLSPLAMVLEPLSRLARLCGEVPGGATALSSAEAYARSDWAVDAAALETMAACDTAEKHGVVLKVIRAIYLPWLDASSRHLQARMAEIEDRIPARLPRLEARPGLVLLFADGLRLDVAHRLSRELEGLGFGVNEDWEWSTIPTVTATAKPAASPMADHAQGGEDWVEFATRLAANGQALTQDRFLGKLKDLGWQCLGSDEVGSPSGSAWTEFGTLDKRGHNEGWKLARAVAGEVRDLAGRIGALLRAGWTEVQVVTDHGWLLMPGGLPKIELKSFLAENRWGRCASLKPGSQTDLPCFRWHWNPSVTIATPPGAGCFRASMEYSHGGVSLQEMVVPRLRVTSGKASPGGARIQDAKWTAARCRIEIVGDNAGMRVDVRREAAAPETSFLADGAAREISGGRVTVFLEQEADIGQKACVVLLDAGGQIIDTLQTTLGG